MLSIQESRVVTLQTPLGIEYTLLWAKHWSWWDKFIPIQIVGTLGARKSGESIAEKKLSIL
jgi:hypothetical protein